jgi:hypothetical protein
MNLSAPRSNLGDTCERGKAGKVSSSPPPPGRRPFRSSSTDPWLWSFTYIELSESVRWKRGGVWGENLRDNRKWQVEVLGQPTSTAECPSSTCSKVTVSSARPRILTSPHQPLSSYKSANMTTRASEVKNIWIAAGDGDVERVKVRRHSSRSDRVEGISSSPPAYSLVQQELVEAGTYTHRLQATSPADETHPDLLQVPLPMLLTPTPTLPCASCRPPPFTATSELTRLPSTPPQARGRLVRPAGCSDVPAFARWSDQRDGPGRGHAVVHCRVRRGRPVAHRPRSRPIVEERRGDHSK